MPVDTGFTATVQHHVSQSAGPQNSVPVWLPAPASQQWFGDSTIISYARVSIVQHGVSGGTSVDTVNTEPHLEQSEITAMSEDLVEALARQPGMIQISLTSSVVGHAHVVSSLGQECDIVTQSCPLHITIQTPWRPFRFTMPFIVLPGGGDVVIGLNI